MGYLTPNSIPANSVGRLIDLPASYEFIALIHGALLPLTEPENWEPYGATTPEQAAAAFRGILDSFLLGRTPVSVPIGTILPYAAQLAPDGWLPCNGTAISRAAFPELFAVIGTWFGAGDGSTTFNLPNTLGRAIVGTGGAPPAITARTLGDKFGTEKHALTVDEMPAHTHNARWSPVGAGGGSFGSWTYATPYNNTGTIMENAGGGQPHNNVQPSIALTMIIRAK